MLVQTLDRHPGRRGGLTGAPPHPRTAPHGATRRRDTPPTKEKPL